MAVKVAMRATRQDGEGGGGPGRKEGKGRFGPTTREVKRGQRVWVRSGGMGGVIMCNRGNVLHYKMRQNIINFDKARFEVVVGDGFNDGGFYQSSDVDI